MDKINHKLNYIRSRSIGFKALPSRAVYINNNLAKGKKLTFVDTFRLRSENIKQVIDLRGKKIRFWETLGCKINGIKLIKNPIKAKALLTITKKDFEMLNEMVSKNNAKTYVHCCGGRHRSTLVTAACEILNKNKTLEEALAWIKSDKGNYFDPKLEPKNYKLGSLKRKRKEELKVLLEKALERFVEVMKE